MSSKRTRTCTIAPLLAFLLAAAALYGCGGESSDGPEATTVRSGVAVDPYIEGAVFQEVTAGGSLRQRQSTPSDDQGRFQFSSPLLDGSTVEMKPGARGIHAGAPFGGLLKRTVREGDGEPLVVSPLTTLVANGVTPERLLELLTAAGFDGLGVEDLATDPMAGLSDRIEEVGVADLRLLQANMAAHALLVLTGDPQLGEHALADPDTVRLFAELAEAVRTTLNPAVPPAWAAQAGAAPEHPFTLGDAIHVAARLQRELVARLHEHGGPHGAPGTLDEAMAAVMGGAGPMARSVYEARTGIVPGAPSPGPEPQTPPQTPEVPEEPGPTEPLPDGLALYDTTCASCHKAGAADPAGFAPDLAGAGALVAPKFQASHMGTTLSAAETEALAAWLDGVAPAEPVPTDPTAPPDGVALYAAECAGCHGALMTTNVPGRTAAQVRAAIGANAGGMGGILLTDAELDALAEALPPPLVTDPTVPADGSALYASDCGACHAAGIEDPGGFAPDLAGAGALAAPKLAAGHQGIVLSGAELEALAAWLDSLAVPTQPPPPPGGGNEPPLGSCTACHGQPPSGAAFPNTAGAHAVHAALPTVGADCTVCHLGAVHDGAVDLAFPTTFDGRRGPATDNLDGTCSNVSCHGGQTTPEWWTGSIAVDVQCRSCHAAGTGEDNGYSSGRHTLHVQNRGYDCTVCHSTARLEGLHFSGLDTPGRQRVAASTVGGSDTQVTAYGSETRNCSTQGCHGSKRW